MKLASLLLASILFTHLAHTAEKHLLYMATRRTVATLKDEQGKTVSGSKFFEAVFLDGKVTAVGDQFGVGRAAGAK